MISNRDPDANYKSMPQSVPWYVGEALKHQVRTSLPGVVVEYDAETMRARIQPATDLLMVDGSSLPRAPILEVPVLHPSGSEYIFHVPLMPDDPVMLLFSARSLANFKETLEQGPLLYDNIMAEEDCVCIPYPPLELVPVMLTPTGGAMPVIGATIQTHDGITFFSLQPKFLSVTIDDPDTPMTTGMEIQPEHILTKTVDEMTAVTTRVEVEADHILVNTINEASAIIATGIDIQPEHIIVNTFDDATAITTGIEIQADHILVSTDDAANAYATGIDIQPEHIIVNADDETNVDIQPAHVVVTIDGTTNVDIQPADVTVTIDGSTSVRAQAGQVTITAANVTINGDTSIVGATTIMGNVDVTGNLAISGTVDGVDVGSHRHGGVRSGGSQTGTPS